MNSAGTSTSHNILTGQTERIAAVNPNGPVRFLTKVLLAVSFALIPAGSIITDKSNAAMQGQWLAASWWVILAAVCALTFIITLTVQIIEVRRSVKKLAWASLALIGLELVLEQLAGGISHPAFSMLRGAIIQSFFCAVLALAVVSSHAWFRDLTHPVIQRTGNVAFLQFLKFTMLVVFVQVILGIGVRHSNAAGDMFFPFVLAHIAWAFMVIVVITFFNLRTWQVYKDVGILRRTGIATGVLIIFQLILGVLAILANRSRLEHGTQAFSGIISNLHYLTGTLLLGVVLAGTLRSHRILDQTDYSQNPGQAYQPREVL